MIRVTKLLLITLYPTVIMNHKGLDGERESIERKSLFQLRALFGMKHNKHNF